MGLLDRAINFAKDAYNYVENVVTGGDNTKSDAAKQASKTNNNTQKGTQNTPAKPTHPNSTFEKKDSVPTQNVDTVQITKSQKYSKTKKQIEIKTKVSKKVINTQDDVAKKMQEINNLKKKYNVSDKEFNDVILSKLGYSEEEFKKLTPTKKMTVLNTISGTTGLYILDKNKNNPNIDKAEIWQIHLLIYKKL